jgi:hypothetical protein
LLLFFFFELGFSFAFDLYFSFLFSLVLMVPPLLSLTPMEGYSKAKEKPPLSLRIYNIPNPPQKCTLPSHSFSKNSKTGHVFLSFFINFIYSIIF